MPFLSNKVGSNGCVTFHTLSSGLVPPISRPSNERLKRAMAYYISRDKEDNINANNLQETMDDDKGVDSHMGGEGQQDNTGLEKPCGIENYTIAQFPKNRFKLRNSSFSGAYFGSAHHYPNTGGVHVQQVYAQTLEEKRLIQREVDRMIATNNKILKALEEEALNKMSQTGAYRNRSQTCLGMMPIPMPDSGTGDISVAQGGQDEQELVGMRGKRYAGLRGGKSRRRRSSFSSTSLVGGKGGHRSSGVERFHSAKGSQRERGAPQKPPSSSSSLLSSYPGSSNKRSAAVAATAVTTARGYATKNVKQEITLAPSHLGRYDDIEDVLARRSASEKKKKKFTISEQLAEGLSDIDKERIKNRRKSIEMQQTRQEQSKKLLQSPRTSAGWMINAPHPPSTTQCSSTQYGGHAQHQQDMPHAPTQSKFPDIKKMLTYRPWYLSRF